MDLRASGPVVLIVTAYLSSVFSQRERLLLLFARERVKCNGFISRGRVVFSSSGSGGFGVQFNLRSNPDLLS